MSTSLLATKAISRIGAVSAVLGIALAMGAVTTASAAATPATHAAVKATPAKGGGHGDDGGCSGLIVLLCN
ncbi:hypothetical protein ACWD1Y_13500 [Streptomyces sp. NPDC002814]|jgi:hypothetical protein|uniref:hypothetical protein n=1 Tax=Streptomyces sp. GESEQ-4 TaxID=2812655 RepID=UPI001B32B524|nr:hypothetical protein [Streptomyces sp. GESEQ-4]